jgi:hypothetical protein
LSNPLQGFESLFIPRSIWQYSFEGKTVYYFESDGFDMLNPLYDEDGTYFCAPDGGFTGKGDMLCPTFRDKGSNKQLFWRNNARHN